MKTTVTPSLKNIAVMTGGGDAPGLNAVIRAVVITALNYGWQCYGIRDSYDGLLAPARYPNGGLIHLTREAVRGITHLGGTILGTTNKGNPFEYPMPGSDGQLQLKDRSDELIAAFKQHQLDVLVAIGGDGALSIAHTLSQKGLAVMGVPKTIDNDLAPTAVTFGFDTAVSFATECIDRLHATGHAHSRIMVVEVMGRHAGWIALHAGVAGTADAILIPEIPYDLNRVVAKIKARRQEGHHFSLAVVAEGARPTAGTVSMVERPGGVKRLGGIGQKVAEELQALTGQDARAVVLGHLLRGGTPTAFDRLISLRFGAAAVRGLAAGHRNVMVALDSPGVRYVPLAEATKQIKLVPLDSDLIQTARELGICLGD
ncbi:MAG: ATP-dependent 6-phosphofructokinase [Anaerolineae bacterium]|nr:ATP-dependent 6-phosphofructokinase [Anaerolineae bacterium]